MPKGALRHSKPRLDQVLCPVRKHRAPNGALRQRLFHAWGEHFVVRKHRAPKGALRLNSASSTQEGRPGQKAPSAKRCIKTGSARQSHSGGRCVRKHRAPKGALRLQQDKPLAIPLCVRKHRAPNGALRRKPGHCPKYWRTRQKAPSAKRCIKTPTS